jgi:hypothetical protein
MPGVEDRVPVRSIPCVVLRNCSDREWNRAPRARGRSAWIFPGPDHFSNSWSVGCIALAKTAIADQILRYNVIATWNNQR